MRSKKIYLILKKTTGSFEVNDQSNTSGNISNM